MNDSQQERKQYRNDVNAQVYRSISTHQIQAEGNGERSWSAER